MTTGDLDQSRADRHISGYTSGGTLPSSYVPPPAGGGSQAEPRDRMEEAVAAAAAQLGRLNAHYHIQQRLSSLPSSKGTALIGGVLGAGALVLSFATSTFVGAVMVIYFLFSMPRIKLFAYRLVPHSWRARVILIGDEIFTKVGGYVLGNFLTSVIAGAGTYVWLLIFGIPYPLLLAMLVALLDLIPVIGSSIGGAVVSLVALTVSLRVAAALRLLLQEITFRRLDST